MVVRSGTILALSCKETSSPTYRVDLTGAVVAAVALLVPQLLAVVVALVLVALAEDTDGHGRAHLGTGGTGSGLGHASSAGGGAVHG